MKCEDCEKEIATESKEGWELCDGCANCQRNENDGNARFEAHIYGNQYDY